MQKSAHLGLNILTINPVFHASSGAWLIDSPPLECAIKRLVGLARREQYPRYAR